MRCGVNVLFHPPYSPALARERLRNSYHSRWVFCGTCRFAGTQSLRRFWLAESWAKHGLANVTARLRATPILVIVEGALRLGGPRKDRRSLSEPSHASFGSTKTKWLSMPEGETYPDVESALTVFRAAHPKCWRKQESIIARPTRPRTQIHGTRARVAPCSEGARSGSAITLLPPRLYPAALPGSGSDLPTRPAPSMSLYKLRCRVISEHRNAGAHLGSLRPRGIVRNATTA